MSYAADRAQAFIQRFLSTPESRVPIKVLAEQWKFTAEEKQAVLDALYEELHRVCAIESRVRKAMQVVALYPAQPEQPESPIMQGVGKVLADLEARGLKPQWTGWAYVADDEEDEDGWDLADFESEP